MKTTIPSPLQTTISTPPAPAAHSLNHSLSPGEAGNPLRSPANSRTTSNKEQRTTNEEPRPAGRPSQRTSHLIDAIASQIAEWGMSDTAAARHLAVPSSTLSRWKYLHPEIELRFLSAREDFRMRHLHETQNARTRDGRRDWKASAWLLERVFPEDYARRPGRKVNPAPEHETWLDEARAEQGDFDDRRDRREFENLSARNPEAARDLIAEQIPAPFKFAPAPNDPIYIMTPDGNLEAWSSYQEAAEAAKTYAEQFQNSQNSETPPAPDLPLAEPPPQTTHSTPDTQHSPPIRKSQNSQNPESSPTPDLPPTEPAPHPTHSSPDTRHSPPLREFQNSRNSEPSWHPAHPAAFAAA